MRRLIPACFATVLLLSLCVARTVAQTPVAETMKPASPPEGPSSMEMKVDAHLQQDAILIGKLAAPGWEALPLEALRARDGALQTPDGRTVAEAAGHPSDFLLEFGCTDAVSRRFKRGQRSCTAAIYRFSSVSGAYGAYTNLRVGASTVLVRGNASSEDDDTISFWKGNCFVALSTTAENDDEAKSLLTSLANVIAPQIADTSEKPALLRQLPMIERTQGSERFYLGPIAARQHVSIPYIDLSLAKCKGAISADYQFPHPYSERLRLLLIDYQSPSVAESVFKTYRTALASDSKVVEDADRHLLCKVNNSFLMCGRSGDKRIFVVWGARKKYAPGMLARQLRD